MPSIEITCPTPEASIYYTTDGSEPSSSSNLYSSPISVGDLSTVRAIAIKEGWENSDVNTSYTIQNVVETALLTPNGSGGASDRVEIRANTIVSKQIGQQGESVNISLIELPGTNAANDYTLTVEKSSGEVIQTFHEAEEWSNWDPTPNKNTYDFNLGDTPVKVKTLWYWTICLSADTLITLSDNSVKPFKDLLPTDKVKVWNFDEGKYDEASLLWLAPIKVSTGYHLVKTNTGRTIKQVNNHRFFDLDENKFERIRSMVGHKVWTADGPEYIAEVKLIEEPIEYCNAISFYHMNLITNGFLTSCGFNNIYPIKDMKFVKEEKTPRPFEEFNISREFYEGMRMSEQYSPVEEINPYVNRLEEENLVSFT